ncbi:MAG: hypothetical protein JW821_00475 [Deltaproteobacteria bacterium]|nr:hypothetical protein [Deltaproteobacteria bacterium]
MNHRRNSQLDEKRALETLVALKRINESLLQGLRACLFVLENEEHLDAERRLALITQIRELIVAGESAFENFPPKQDA